MSSLSKPDYLLSKYTVSSDTCKLGSKGDVGRRQPGAVSSNTSIIINPVMAYYAITGF